MVPSIRLLTVYIAYSCNCVYLPTYLKIDVSIKIWITINWTKYEQINDIYVDDQYIWGVCYYNLFFIYFDIGNYLDYLKI